MNDEAKARQLNWTYDQMLKAVGAHSPAGDEFAKRLALAAQALLFLDRKLPRKWKADRA